MSADPAEHGQDQHPTPPANGPAEPELSDDDRLLLQHRAAVRGNLAMDPGDIGQATRTVRHAIEVAEYAFVDVPVEVHVAAEHVHRWHLDVKRQLAAERAEREATGTTAVAQQAAIERAWYRRRAAERAALERQAMAHDDPGCPPQWPRGSGGREAGHER